MTDIAEIDRNFAVKTNIQREGLRFYSAQTPPFRVSGIFMENGRYRRIPEEVARTVSPGVLFLHANTAGGRVRFVTDSPYVAIHAEMDGVARMSHFALTGVAGFDLYDGTRYVKTFTPPLDVESGFEGVVDLGTGMKQITINFPLYSNVRELSVGLREGCFLGAPEPYVNAEPIVYYGSSITQGGCASRPGMAYQAIVSRRLNCDYVNLGFSGSAKAEDAIAEYIAGLPMSVFVYDYDHNAPNAEYLASTHEKMFRTIRRSHPDLPVIMMSRPQHVLTADVLARRAVVEKTYRDALADGDKNVYFLDGTALTALCGGDGNVDGVHPTDFGFVSMAEAVCGVLEQIDGFAPTDHAVHI